MSQEEFAELVETARTNVSIWECEYDNIHPEYGRFLHLKMLAENKGLDFDKLIQDKESCMDDYERFIQGDIPKKIRTIRSLCRCSKRELGYMLGFSGWASAISQWESGRTKPLRKSFYKLQKIAASVGIDMDKLNEDPDFYKDEYAEFIETDCGDKIKYIRLQYDMFMEQFAEVIGTSGNTISEWEAGNCIPIRDWFPAIKKAASNKGIELDALNGHPEIYRDPYMEHIHNHIIFNSVALDCTRKFKNFFFCGLALQTLSDIICFEHGKSIIQKLPVGKRKKRTIYPQRHSFRDALRSQINDALQKKPQSLESLHGFCESAP